MTTSTKTKTAVDPKDYNALVAKARLRAITLAGSKFDLKQESASADRKAWRYDIADYLADCSFDAEGGLLHGLFSYQVRCLQGRRKLMSLEAFYRVTYTVSGETDAQSCELFMRKVGRFAAYPYFRSLFAALSSQSNIVLPPLPVISDQPYRIPSVGDQVPEAKAVAGPAPRKRIAKPAV